jgi:hypothetical protein
MERVDFIAHCKTRPSVIALSNLIEKLSPEEKEEFKYEACDYYCGTWFYMRNDMEAFDKRIDNLTAQLENLITCRKKRIAMRQRNAHPSALLMRFQNLSRPWKQYVLGALSGKEEEIMSDESFYSMLGQQSQINMTKDPDAFDLLEFIDKVIIEAEQNAK